MNTHRHRMIPQALIVGIATGLLTVCFRLALDVGERFSERLIAQANQHNWPGICVLFAFILLSIVVSVGLVNYLAPEAGGSGVPHLKSVLLENQRLRWYRVLFVKFASTLIGNTAGLILGRGGPSVHMGGAIGESVRRVWSGKEELNPSVLLAAGGGAGLTAAFNAPLSGLTFVLEELDRRCSSLEFIAAAVACLSADMVCRALLGQSATFHIPTMAAPAINQLGMFLPLGICAGLIGALFNCLMLRGQSLTCLRGWRRWLWWLILAGLITLTARKAPELLGGGQMLIKNLLNERDFSLQIILMYGAVRFGLTLASANSGAAGGIFMPVLAIGALMGWSYGLIADHWAMNSGADPRLLATVGMAAFFTGVVQAPLTAIVLIIELTGDYALILPLFIACFSALLIADVLKTTPIYDALMKTAADQR